MVRSTGWLVGGPGGIVALMLAAGLSADQANAQVVARSASKTNTAGWSAAVRSIQIAPTRTAMRRAIRTRRPSAITAPRLPASRRRRHRATASHPIATIGPPAERDYGPPPGRESAAPPPRRDFPPPPRRDYRPPEERDYGPPPGRETMPPPPAERDQGGDPREFARPYPDNGPRFQRPMRGPNGQPVCPRDFTVQDGLCKPYIRR